MSILAGLIALLGCLFLLVAALGVIAPSIFKDKKTGDVPKRLRLAVSGIAASFIAFVIAGALLPDAPPAADETSSAATPAAEPDASTPDVATEVAAVSAEQPTAPEPTYEEPLELADARRFADNTLRVINEAEQSLNDGIQLGDRAGITRHVWRPLQAELDRWPTLIGRHPDDQREHFLDCQDAALKLQMLSHGVTRERTVESMKYLRKDEAEYRKAKQRCEQQVKATDSQIKAAAAL